MMKNVWLFLSEAFVNSRFDPCVDALEVKYVSALYGSNLFVTAERLQAEGTVVVHRRLRRRIRDRTEDGNATQGLQL
jgi:hypothetical protein